MQRTDAQSRPRPQTGARARRPEPEPVSLEMMLAHMRRFANDPSDFWALSTALDSFRRQENRSRLAPAKALELFEGIEEVRLAYRESDLEHPAVFRLKPPRTGGFQREVQHR